MKDKFNAMKVLLDSLHLNGHTIGFLSLSFKSEHACAT